MSAESETLARSHLELAESVWSGSRRAYALFLSHALARYLTMIGTDEYRCRVCDRANYTPDGLTRLHGIWFSPTSDEHYCGNHWPQAQS